MTRMRDLAAFSRLLKMSFVTGNIFTPKVRFGNEKVVVYLDQIKANKGIGIRKNDLTEVK